jgi:hypothetical protein
MQRGRKGTKLNIVPLNIPGQQQRPEPPKEFSPSEVVIWNQTVGGMRPDWFGPETLPLLRAYCTITAAAQHAAQQLRKTRAKPESAAYMNLAALHRGQSKAMISIATKLRITPQANRKPDHWEPRDATFVGNPRPWDKGYSS